MNCYRERHDKWISQRSFVAAFEILKYSQWPTYQRRKQRKKEKRRSGSVVRAPGPRSTPPPLPSPLTLFRSEDVGRALNHTRTWPKSAGDEWSGVMVDSALWGLRVEARQLRAWMFHCRLWKTQTLINYRRYLSPKSYQLLRGIRSFDKLTRRCVSTCWWETFRRFVRYD